MHQSFGDSPVSTSNPKTPSPASNHKKNAIFMDHQKTEQPKIAETTPAVALTRALLSRGGRRGSKLYWYHRATATFLKLLGNYSEVWPGPFGPLHWPPDCAQPVWRAALRCVMLCCVLLCCAVLCCAVLCWCVVYCGSLWSFASTLTDGHPSHRPPPQPFKQTTVDTSSTL